MPETMPTVGIKEMIWSADVSARESVSQFSFVEQIYDFGGKRRTVEITLANMSKEDALQWRAFFLALNGKVGTFYVTNVKPWRYPNGVATGAPQTDAGNVALSSSLLTTGWTGNVEDILKAGDEFSLNDRIYTVTADVDSDASGDATVPIWPYLGGSPPASGVDLDLGDDCQGTFRLKEIPSWVNRLGEYQPELTFVGIEALA